MGQCLKWQELSGTVRRQRKGMQRGSELGELKKAKRTREEDDEVQPK